MSSAPSSTAEGTARFVVLGYGNQGRAHALNLRESGLSVAVGARPGGAGARAAKDEGFTVRTPAEAAAESDLLILALPDELHGSVYAQDIQHHLPEGATIGVLHGMSLHYRLLQPSDRHGAVMVAPKGPGTTLRNRYLEGAGIPCLLAVHQESPRGDAARLARAWADGIGCGRAAIIDSDVATETRSDLFGEQAVLCGGILALIRAAFETLLAAGVPPEIAWIECGQELRQVADLLYARGPDGMMRAISTTAAFGAVRTADRLDDVHLRTMMTDLLREIDDGTFLAAWQRATQSADNDLHSLESRRREIAAHPMNAASATVRRWFPNTEAPWNSGTH